MLTRINGGLNTTGFDIVIGNPPYDVYQGKKKNEIKGLLLFDIYQKCKGGKINAYELFLSKVDVLLKQKGINCQIFQNSFLADNTSFGVRKHYIDNHNFVFIDSFPERDNLRKRVFESVKMSVCILLSKKDRVNDFNFLLKVHKDKTFSDFYTVNLSKSEIIEFDKKNYIIPSIKNEEKKIFIKYYKSKDSVDYLNYFECKEGELNMTFHEKYMTSNKDFPLIVKGAQTLRYRITNTPSQGIIEYVDKENYMNDYGTTQKAQHHKIKRIVLQGITGANDKIRLIGTLINENVFCANSCNYIISNHDNKNISIYSILGLFNSKVTNWIFRKTSTNSNVNCYEVNSLKLPKKMIAYNYKLDRVVRNILDMKANNEDTSVLEQIVDNLFYKLYSFTYEEVKIIDPEFTLTEKEYNELKI